MRVRISYTVNVDNDFRQAISDFYGRPRLATRDEVKRWFEAYGDSMNDDLMDALQHAEQHERL